MMSKEQIAQQLEDEKRDSERAERNLEKLRLGKQKKVRFKPTNVQPKKKKRKKR